MTLAFGTNVVDVYVRYLRKRIDVPGTSSMFTTLRGFGYRFEPPSSAVSASR